MRMKAFATFLVAVLLAGCATRPPPTRIETRIGDGSAPRVVLRDQRRPVAERALEVPTRLGTGLRVDESIFSQPPLEAMAYILQEEVGEQIAGVQGPVDVLAFDAVNIGSGLGPARRFGDGPAPVMVGPNPAAAILALAVAGAIDIAVRERRYPSRLHVKMVLSYGDKTSTCEGSEVLTETISADQAWRTALRQAGRECRHLLVINEP